MKLKSASDCLKKKCVAVNMDDYPGITCLEVARPCSQSSYCVEEEFHARMRDLKQEISLNPVLLIMITSFIHEMYEDITCW